MHTGYSACCDGAPNFFELYCFKHYHQARIRQRGSTPTPTHVNHHEDMAP